MDSDRVSSRHCLVRAFAPDGQTIVYSADVGRRSVSMFSTRTPSTENAQARPASGQASGNFAVERARFPARRRLLQVLRSAGHAREGRPGSGRRTGPSRERAGGRLVSRRHTSRRRPRGRREGPVGIPDRQDALRDRAAVSNLRISRRSWMPCEGGRGHRGALRVFRRLEGLPKVVPRRRSLPGPPTAARSGSTPQKQVRDSSLRSWP